MSDGPVASSTGSRWKKIAAAAVAAALFAGLYWRFGGLLSVEYLADQEAALLEYGRDHRLLVLVLAFAIYVAVTGLSLPGAAALSITIGWFFKLLFGPAVGYATALLLVSFASTAGASLAFLLSRYLLRDLVQHRFERYLKRFNEELASEGAFYLLTLRLLPAVPFFVINVVMGLTPIRLRTFWWVSQLGMLPGTCVYLYAGWAVPSLRSIARKLEEQGVFGAILTPPVLIAFVLLGLFPIVVRLLMRRSRLHSSHGAGTERIPSD